MSREKRDEEKQKVDIYNVVTGDSNSYDGL